MKKTLAILLVTAVVILLLGLESIVDKILSVVVNCFQIVFYRSLTQSTKCQQISIVGVTGSDTDNF